MADFIEVPVQSTVPSNWYKEIAQEWNTPSFRGVPPAGPSIKWSIFNYKPHKTGTKTFDYDITVCWYCSNATYIADPTDPVGQPGDPNYDPGVQVVLQRTQDTVHRSVTLMGQVIRLSLTGLLIEII